MPPWVGSYCIQRQFCDFKEESDFSSVLRGNPVHVMAVVAGRSQTKPKKQLTLPWAFSCCRIGRVSTCSCPTSDCKVEHCWLVERLQLQPWLTARHGHHSTGDPETSQLMLSGKTQGHSLFECTLGRYTELF